jgi:DNA (cytosine-5)-methyltransferase 1
MRNFSVVDVFCGAGALTHGFVLEGFDVVAGIDVDDSCKYAYEANNPGSQFINKRIEDLTADEIESLYPEGHIKILVGCAPCQPYSPYTKRVEDKDEKWKLLPRFADLICEIKPEIVSMENVPDLATYNEGELYARFIEQLEAEGYHVKDYERIYCPEYGIPQRRERLVLLASQYGNIEILGKTHPSLDDYKTVEETIAHLDPIKAGETSESDPLHKASGLSDLNLKRIKSSKPGGTWRDWPEELIADCHRKQSGKGYVGVYGRMEWDEPAPTITTQFYGFGNGRFGHPEQDRAISLREGALLQTFPEDYAFVAPGESIYFNVVGRLIGNAVPVDLGRLIARSIRRHVKVCVE